MSFAEELRELLDAYLRCYAAHDAEGCVAFYHPEARLDSPFGPPSVGRDAIRATHSEWFLENEENKVMEVMAADHADALGYALIRYAADLPGEEGAPPAQEAGTSLNVFVRSESGTGWVFLNTSLNADFKEDNG